MVIGFLAGYFFKQFMSNRSDETRLPTAAEYRENWMIASFLEIFNYIYDNISHAVLIFLALETF